jgi:hypothetical protein
MMTEEIARGMVCFFHQKKHSYLIFYKIFRPVIRAQCLKASSPISNFKSPKKPKPESVKPEPDPSPKKSGPTHLYFL